jgi:hypothetical protein
MLNEEQVKALGGDPKNLKIKDQYKKGKELLENSLKRGEKVVYCVWNYLVVGSKSVCADVESMEEVLNE